MTFKNDWWEVIRKMWLHLLFVICHELQRQAGVESVTGPRCNDFVPFPLLASLTHLRTPLFTYAN